MGTGREIRFTYDDLDELWRKSVGEHADITAAYYAGDYGKSLAQAQGDKHRFILEGIGFRAGQRVLDIGCGWGPMLHALREKGGRGVGISLSPAQVACCRRAGLDARLLDWRELPRAAEPPFDEIVSVFDDLRGVGVSIITVGQYLRPTPKHAPMVRYYHPDEFAELKKIAIAKGFGHVESGPLVRSSYHAHEQADAVLSHKAQGTSHK